MTIGYDIQKVSGYHEKIYGKFLAIPKPVREPDIHINQLTTKSIAVQRLHLKNKNYGFHRGWGLSCSTGWIYGNFRLFVTEGLTIQKVSV
jgi:hypothetical protein